MSLQVWLPLNGDFKNYGLSGFSFFGIPASYSDGKIGKAATFNGAVANVIYNNTIECNYTNNFSFSLWMYPIYTGSTAQYAFTVGRADTGGYGYGVQIANATQINVRFGNVITTIDCPSNEWNHITMVVKNSSILVYKNGVLVSTKAVGSLPTYSDGNGIGLGCFHYASGNIYPYYGKLNDFRIYDHALSVKEVKEISKGLVLHYPLNCNGIGIPNLVDNSVTFSGWTAGSGWTLGETDGIKTYSFSRTGATSNNWVRLIPTLQVNGNDYPNGITVSMDIYTPDKSAINQTCFGSLQTYQSNGSRIGWVEPGWGTSTITNGEWCRIFYTFTQAQLLTNYSSGTTYAYTTFSFQLVQNGNISIRKIKIEGGNKATAYTISINDLNDTKESDTSGYQRHGILVSTFPAIDSDTPRYHCAYKYSGSTGNIHYNTTTDLNFIDNFSWSLWVKTNYTGNTAQYAFTVGRADAGGYGYGLHIASTSNCNVRFGNASYSVSVTGGQWTHLVFTKSGTTIKIYKNGELYSTNTFSGTLPTYSDGNGVGIGCFHYTNGNIYPYYGSLSDFRVYATALSAADVKALYTDAGYVDKNGNFHTYEFVEE